MKRAISLLILLRFAGSPSLLILSTSAFAIPSPESETLAISKTLRPIDDMRWKEIAGDRVAEQYVVLEKDTLYDISKRLFGDPTYWPKIWAINNSSITNPHFIRPGKQIAFLPGTGTMLPGVEIADASSAGGSTSPGPGTTLTQHSVVKSDAGSPPILYRHDLPRGEWMKLPAQSWESVQLAMPPEVDPDGFDRRSKLKGRVIKGFEPSSIAATEPIEPLAVITGGRDLPMGLGLTDTVFVRPEAGEVQIGQTYAITREPTRISRDQGESAVGYVYPILGKIEITHRVDELFAGKVVAGRGVAVRGNVLIPVPPRVEIMPPIPGPSAVDATMLVDKSTSTGTVAQYHQVFLDRGSEDGVAPGMVFRAYLYDDPHNGQKITDSNVIRNADIQVVQVSESFSVGVVMNTVVPIKDGITVTLLTDISTFQTSDDITAPAGDLESEMGPRTEDGAPPESLDELGMDPNAADDGLLAPPSETPAAPEAELPTSTDDLDDLDDGKELQDGEKKELQQLEDWNGNPPEGTPEPIPMTTEGEPPALPMPDALGGDGADLELDSTAPPPATAPIDDLDADLNLDAPTSEVAPTPAAPPTPGTGAEEMPSLPSSLDEGSPPDPSLEPMEASEPAPAPEPAATPAPAPAAPKPKTSSKKKQADPLSSDDLEGLLE